VKIEITVLDDDSGDELKKLGQWLHDDEDLRSVRIMAVSAEPTSGEMTGGVVASIEATIMSKELLVALTSAVGGWLASRAAGRRTRIRVRRDNREIDIDTAHIYEADEIAHRIWQELDDEARP
jgi:hypothetical protein